MNENNATKKETTMDDLARIVQGGFLSVEERLDRIETDVSTLKTDVHILKTDVAEIKTTLGNVEADLNKKVDKFTHNDLEYRVEKLEKKFA
jgi:DNA anti-recombination protein RmuC